MKIFYELNENFGLSLVLGFFDGVHIAHKTVLEAAVTKQCKTALITFKDHPLCYLQNRIPQYICSLNDRLARIEKCGIDYVYLLDFNDYIANLNAEKYLKDVLIANFKPEYIITGFNHTFGAKKGGNREFLTQNQKKYGYIYEEINPLLKNDILISSSNVRYFLWTGEVDKAVGLLGHPFEFENIVIEGQKLGRTINFPTINLKYPDDIVEIPYGVYEGSVLGHKALINWGTRPTVNGDEGIVEAHILNFNENLYGKSVKVSFQRRIRDEKKFDNLDELKRQIQTDIKSISV